MTVKELKELLEQFDENKPVCINHSSRYSGSYAYDVREVKDASLSPYWSANDEEEQVVRIELGEQIGSVE